MKLGYKILLGILAVIIIGLFVLLIRFYTRTCDVTFDTKGGTIYQAIKIKSGKSIELPPDPVLPGYEFTGWYIGDSKFDVNMIIYEDITIVAHWQPIEIETVK